MSMIDTVPTADEVNGDFGMAGVTIYNPFSSHPNPAFDATKPVGPANPQVIRDPFPANVIPKNLIDPKAQLFLRQFVPRPNMDMGMNGCGMTMMGVPQVVGGGAACNNYLDVRNEHHVTDQGTIRFDQTF